MWKCVETSVISVSRLSCHGIKHSGTAWEIACYVYRVLRTRCSLKTQIGVSIANV